MSDFNPAFALTSQVKNPFLNISEQKFYGGELVSTNSFSGLLTGSAPPVEPPDGSVVDRKTDKGIKVTDDHGNRLTLDTAQSDVKLDNVQLVSPNNILDNYRSYTYNFTLAALSKENMADPISYRNDKKLNFVILKSGGKGSIDKWSTSYSAGAQSVYNNLSTDPTATVESIAAAKKNLDAANTADLTTEFNKSSPGRFDMYLDDVEIETLMTFTANTDTTMATGVKFDVIEPYSINGFIEALHVGAVSAGYKSYIGASFLLKMEFIGYRALDGLPEAEKVKNSTRYFVIKFTAIDVDLTEKGTRYRCTAIPFHEGGFGQANVLKAPIKMTGNSVKEILKSFEEKLNEQIRKTDQSSKPAKDSTKHDVYEIKFADSDGNYEKDTNEFSASLVKQILRERSLYEFADYGDEKEVDNNGRKKSAPKNTDPGSVSWTPTKGVVQFPSRSRIHECISAVIRDSEYVRNILRTLGSPGSKLIDSYGMVDYFIVNMEVTPTTYDEVNNTEFYKYTYVVSPYKVHFTKIPRYGSQKIDETKLKKLTARKYNYFYTGKNTSLINFKLKFDTLFYEAVPRALGNSNFVASTDALTKDGNVQITDKPTDSKNAVRDQNGSAPVKTIPDSDNRSGQTAGTPNSTPYAVMARNMHEAIINSRTGLILGDLEIIGDPVYLVTSGHGNYKPKKLNEIYTVDGEVSYLSGEVLIDINFRNPEDIGSNGFFKFDQNKVPFGGVYRVTSVRHTFKEGVFRQLLSVMRIPGQIAGQDVTPTPVEDKAETRPDPLDQPVKDVTKAVRPAQRAATGFNLLTQLQNIATGFTEAGTGILKSLTAPLTESVGKFNKGLSDATNSINSVGSKITSAITGVTTEFAQAGEKLGISSQNLANASPLALLSLTALSKTIPTGVSLKESAAQGVNLDFPASKLANLPPSQPNTTAPSVEVNQKDLENLLTLGGVAALASAFGTNKVSSIPGSILPSSTINSLTRDFASPTLANPFANSNNLLNASDSSIVANKSLARLGTVSNSVEVNLKVSNSVNVADVANSVTAKLGSNLSSPLYRLNDANNT
jgi:hypothetical protein